MSDDEPERMTREQYCEACRALGWSPSYGAAKHLGIAQKTAAAYSAGTSKIPHPIRLLLEAKLREAGL
jgi:hypothetical protein